MYGDQYGGFLCGYWGLKGLSKKNYSQTTIPQSPLIEIKCLPNLIVT